ncbi:MAG: methionyl-tRNA formyltransferase [Candidatus Marinimicrobia bacterium]|nr:methionyl-tRNA formyltransferase [Candidatus Neomarinimicrobiota bacterium]
MKIVFMGTPEFAVPALDVLHASHHCVRAVVTSPDKPQGRGRKMAVSEVKQKALDLGLPVLQPKQLKDPLFLEQLKEYHPNILVVIAFRVLPPEVYTIPSYGAINAHASLLPKYRGAAPIHWAVYHGEKETGITIFQINKTVDTGQIIYQTRIPITAKDTTGTLYNTLKNHAANALLQAVDMLEKGNVQPIPQNHAAATPAPKITADTGALDFTQTGEQLCNAVRAFTPWPGAFFYLNGKRIKIIKASYLKTDIQQPGTITLISKQQFAIHCADGYFLPAVIQSPGRKKMNVTDWLNGTDISSCKHVDL